MSAPDIWRELTPVEVASLTRAERDAYLAARGMEVVVSEAGKVTVRGRWWGRLAMPVEMLTG